MSYKDFKYHCISISGMSNLSDSLRNIIVFLSIVAFISALKFRFRKEEYLLI